MNSDSITLAAVVGDPSLAESLSPDRARVLLPQLAIVMTALAGRVLVEPKVKETAIPQLIDVKALSKILGKSTDFVYEHARTWPFTVRLGARDLMFDLEKLNRWLAARTGAR